MQKPGETQRTFTGNAESDALLISFHAHVILGLCNCRISLQTFFIHGKTSVTSPLEKIIKFHAVFKLFMALLLK